MKANRNEVTQRSSLSKSSSILNYDDDDETDTKLAPAFRSFRTLRSTPGKRSLIKKNGRVRLSTKEEHAKKLEGAEGRRADVFES
jgi:hypothetical protein